MLNFVILSVIYCTVKYWTMFNWVWFIAPCDIEQHFIEHDLVYREILNCILLNVIQCAVRYRTPFYWSRFSVPWGIGQHFIEHKCTMTYWTVLLSVIQCTVRRWTAFYWSRFSVPWGTEQHFIGLIKCTMKYWTLFYWAWFSVPRDVELYFIEHHLIYCELMNCILLFDSEVHRETLLNNSDRQDRCTNYQWKRTCCVWCLIEECCLYIRITFRDFQITPSTPVPKIIVDQCFSNFWTFLLNRSHFVDRSVCERLLGAFPKPSTGLFVSGRVFASPPSNSGVSTGPIWTKRGMIDLHQILSSHSDYGFVWFFLRAWEKYIE
jgi:hypothetical protein